MLWIWVEFSGWWANLGTIENLLPGGLVNLKPKCKWFVRRRLMVGKSFLFPRSASGQTEASASLLSASFLNRLWRSATGHRQNTGERNPTRIEWRQPLENVLDNIATTTHFPPHGEDETCDFFFPTVSRDNSVGIISDAFHRLREIDTGNWII